MSRKISKLSQLRTLHLQAEDEAIRANDDRCSKIEQQFKQSIMKKIECVESLAKVGEGQRCLSHNIPLSLYCSQCRKVICASCMYSSITHKRHKVIPLQNSSKEIREDINMSISKLDKMTNHYIRAVNASNSRIVEFDKLYNEAIFELSSFYDEILDSVKIKKSQQINFIKERQGEVKSQLKRYYQVISEIQFYVFEKFKTYGNSQLKAQLLVPSKTILEILGSSGTKCLEADFDRLRFQLDPAKMSSIKQELIFRLEAINRPNISYHIKSMEKRLNTKKVTNNYGLSSPKIPTFSLAKEYKSSLSILASPRSARCR